MPWERTKIQGPKQSPKLSQEILRKTAIWKMLEMEKAKLLRVSSLKGS